MLTLYWRASGAKNHTKQVIPKEYFQLPDYLSISNPKYITETLFKKFHIPDAPQNLTSASFYDSSVSPSPLSKDVLDRLKTEQKQLLSDRTTIKKQIDLWNEARGE
ncbi:hypothetical protein ACT7DB_17310 [Bacillus cereus]